MPEPVVSAGRTKKLIGVDLRALVNRPSGIGYYTLAILRELAARDRATYRGLAHKPVAVEDELRALGIELDSPSAPSAPLGVIWQQLRLPQILTKEGIDLLWSPITTLPRNLPVPGVVTVHDLTPLLFPETHQPKVRWSVLPFLESSVQQASFVLADSHSTAKDLRDSFPECADRTVVAYPGIDAEFKPVSEEEKAEIRRQVGAPDGYLFFAGTVEPRKNLAPLLDAWETLRRADPSTPPLILAGPYGWRSRSLVRRIKRLEPLGLQHRGHVERSELVRLFQAATLFVFPSLYEGFGLPVAEAMACGVPTIVADSSSLPEIAGKAALVLEITDGADLAAAIRQLLADPALASDLAARSTEQVSRFTWARTTDLVEDVFSRALE